MAHRDRSQGHSFVFAPLKELLELRALFGDEDVFVEYPSSAHIINFAADGSVGSVKLPENNQVGEIKQNLDRLQSLHQKLHMMLSDLNQATGAKPQDDEEE